MSAPASGELLAFRGGDVAALLTAAAAPPPPNARPSWPVRDVAVVDVLAHCGLRVSELTALTLTGVDHAGATPLVLVRGGAKGGKARSVPIPSSTVDRIDTYLEALRHAGSELEPAGAVVRAPRRQRSHPAAHRQPVASPRRRQRNPRPPRRHAHALRHFYGSELALRGVPVPVIQQLLGHADPRTTSIYTAAHGTDLAHALHDAGLL